MIRDISIRNVNQALGEGFFWLKVAGLQENSRNGPVVVAPAPVITVYDRPWERVLFDPVRDANPVFHLMESIWMFAGRKDLAWIAQFNSRFASYAEDDGQIHGAYGHRWFNHFMIDQPFEVITELTHNPGSRRAVMSMWDPSSDLAVNKRDVPCNTTIYFDLRFDVLNMTVCNRSNDIVWGAYGANAVHMSFLQEYIAAKLNVPMGKYRQFSNNFHAYLDNPVAQKYMDSPPADDTYDKYAHGTVRHVPLDPDDDFIQECQDFVAGQFSTLKNNFLTKIARPLHDEYLARKDKRVIGLESSIQDVDWVVAFNEWCERRDNVNGK